MINSLSIDSHITRNQQCKIKTYSVDNKLQKQSNKTVAPKNTNFNIATNKPAQISFSGLFGSNALKKFVCSRNIESLSATREIFNEVTNKSVAVKEYFLKNILSSAKEFIVDGKVVNKEDKEAIKGVHQSTKDLIEKAIDFIQNPEKELKDDSVKKFLDNESNGKTINELLENVKKEIKFKNKNDDEFEFDINTPEYKKFVKEKVNEAVDVLHSVENPGWLFKSEKVKKFLKKAEDSQAVFTAAVGVAFACLLRPATIVSIPGKKNKDDKKYASAHSIASGAIGYIFSMAISSPIASGIKKMTKDPGKFFEEQHLKNYITEKDLKNKTNFADTKRVSIVRGYINLIPEVITSPMKAVMTIALIPPILKYVFGLEKSSHKNNKNIAAKPQEATLLAFKSASEPARKVFQNFMEESK